MDLYLSVWICRCILQLFWYWPTFSLNTLCLSPYSPLLSPEVIILTCFLHLTSPIAVQLVTTSYSPLPSVSGTPHAINPCSSHFFPLDCSSHHSPHQLPVSSGPFSIPHPLAALSSRNFKLSSTHPSNIHTIKLNSITNYVFRLQCAHHLPSLTRSLPQSQFLFLIVHHFLSPWLFYNKPLKPSVWVVGVYWVQVGILHTNPEFSHLFKYFAEQLHYPAGHWTLSRY